RMMMHVDYCNVGGFGEYSGQIHCCAHRCRSSVSARLWSGIWIPRILWSEGL
ncbi:hypothetical protein U1Q18_049012, partial [Sarracenia purpurea var. burkii]